MKSSCKNDKSDRRAPLSAPDKMPELLCAGLQPVAMKHENPWFRILSRGGYYTFEYERPQVAILPIVDNKGIVMVRVLRPVIGDCPLELPAGDSMRGETPRDAAAREFKEETGIVIEDMARFEPELAVSEMPGRNPVLLSVFAVHISKMEFDSRKEHDVDIHSVEVISIPDLAEKIISGEIYVGVPCAILSRFIFRRIIETNGTLRL